MYKYKRLRAGQLPQEHLFFLENLLNFIITKCFKQEVDGGIGVYLDECSSCDLYNWKYEDLSKSRDQKAMTFLTAIGIAVVPL